MGILLFFCFILPPCTNAQACGAMSGLGTFQQMRLCGPFRGN